MVDDLNSVEEFVKVTKLWKWRMLLLALLADQVALVVDGHAVVAEGATCGAPSAPQWAGA